MPPLRADYQTFVRQARGGEAATRADLEWWRERLSGKLPIISLAADSARAPSGAGQRVSIDLGLDLTNRIDALASQHQATSFMVLLAAFKLLIHRYTGQTDLLIGVHVSGRDRPEFVDVIGMFVNTLVLRTAVTPELDRYRTAVARPRSTSRPSPASISNSIASWKPSSRSGYRAIIRWSGMRSPTKTFPRLRLSLVRRSSRINLWSLPDPAMSSPSRFGGPLTACYATSNIRRICSTRKRSTP